MPTMANCKAKKKSKLRYAEYYDFQCIQDKLYTDSMKGKEFKNLVELITLPQNIKLAYRNLKKNSGSKTAGTDKRTIENLAKLSEERLIQLVQRKLSWYVPQAVRRVEIPKGDGKMRPLGIPTIMDRLIQQCVLQVLEPICEAKFHDHSYGFRPNRSQEHAMAQVMKNMQCSNLHFVVDVDIKGFFDNVNHGKLLKQMWTMGIRDKKLISIISAMLKAEVAGIGFPEKGAPQGGIISPLLSNIVLNEFDWWIASQWEEFPTRINYQASINSNGSLCKSNKYTAMKKRSNLKLCTAVRYADDFKIFTNDYQSAVKQYHATVNWLKYRLGLDVNPEKSKVINLKEGYSDFLGFKLTVIKRGKEQNGKDKYVVKSHIRDKAMRKISEEIKDYTRKIEYPETPKGSYEAVRRYNAYVLGIHPVANQSIEYNDNRLSLYCGQRGKCAVTGKELHFGDIHCHHKVPKSKDGDDSYSNLVLVTETVHRLIHATTAETIERYMTKLSLCDKQLQKLNKLRSLANIEEIV